MFLSKQFECCIAISIPQINIHGSGVAVVVAVVVAVAVALALGRVWAVARAVARSVGRARAGWW